MKIQTLLFYGEILELYFDILEKSNYLDFSKIQTETYSLLIDNPLLLKKLNEKIQYIMVDEYQDTNHVQEMIAFKIAGKSQNICVVGDDDQGLYRFRGATIRNIIEFPNRFSDGVCKKIVLNVNYRSEKPIIDFYNKWMNETSGDTFSFDFGKYRHQKTIQSSRPYNDTINVVKLSGKETDEDWFENILIFIKNLKPRISNLNQIAFLFNSVRNDRVIALAEFLEKNGIDVYSPRSNMFFNREEIKCAIGTMLLIFPEYISKLKTRDFKIKDEDLFKYYESCIVAITKYIRENPALMQFVREMGIKHANLYANTDYSFTGILYRIFEFEPFYSWLNVDLNDGIISQRPVRNLSILTQMVAKHDYLQNIEVLSVKKLDKQLEILFNTFFRFLINGGMSEYEDEQEYAPSGCVLFSTIHQSKGMEFPIVVVDSLSNIPRARNNDLLRIVEEKYSFGQEFEPQEETKYYDFWRLYYTAFSRAQDLLVLSSVERENGRKEPSEYFKYIYKELPSFFDNKDMIQKINFNELKEVNIKKNYSFTSHISVYENCSLQYKFYKELGFTPVRVGQTIFGRLVHETLEDIHKTAIRKEFDKITEENIRTWLDSNYDNISKSEHNYLAPRQIDAAYEQVIEYFKKKKDLWSTIDEAEIEIGLVREKYILEGVVDLILNSDNTYELIDFKSEKKPLIDENTEKLARYRKQLEIYAYLIEKKLNKKISRMSLYYTAEKDGIPTISFENDNEHIENTIQEFDRIVDKIECKKYDKASSEQNLCRNCDFRFYCKKV